MRIINSLLLVLLTLCISGLLGACSDSDDTELREVDSQSPGIAAPPAEVDAQGIDEKAVDDPNNPWVLGYRWRGKPPTTMALEGSYVDSNGVKAKINTFPRARANWQYFMTNPSVESLEFEVTLHEGDGPVTIELIRFRHEAGLGNIVENDDDVRIRETFGAITLVPGESASLSTP